MLTLILIFVWGVKKKPWTCFLDTELKTELHAKCEGYKEDKGWQADRHDKN